MYITTAYLYQQIQTVLMIDTSGNYFDARWKPVYSKNLKLNLGVDNVILFQFQNQDQRPISLEGSTVLFRLISRDGEDLLYSRELTVLNAAAGRAKVTIPAQDTRYFQAQLANWSLATQSGDLTQAVFTDDSAGARGTIDIVDSVLPAFVASQLLTVPDQSPEDSRFFSSTVDTDGNSLTTFQIDFAQFSGTLSVQGAAPGAASTVDWYNIDFEDLDTQGTVSSLNFVDSSVRTGINVQGFHARLRLVFDIGTGSVALIQYR